MILNDNSTQQINTLVIQLQNKITNLTNEFRKLNNNINDLNSEISDLEKRVSSNENDADNNIDGLDSKINDLEKRVSSNENAAAAMNTEISANTEAISGKADTGHTHDDRYFTETEVAKKLEDYQAKEWKVLDGNDISGIDFDEVAVSIWFPYNNIEVLYSQQYSKGMLDNTQILMVGGYFVSPTDYGLCNLNFSNGLFSKRNVIFDGKNYTSVSSLRVRYR